MCIITNIIFIVHDAQRKYARKVPLPRHVASQKILYKNGLKAKNFVDLLPECQQQKILP